MLGTAVLVESRQFTRQPTDTTTTVGDKAVLRFLGEFFGGNLDLSWNSGAGWTPLPPGRCSGPRMDLPSVLRGASLSGQTIPCRRTGREFQVRFLFIIKECLRKPSFPRRASANKSILFNLISLLKVFSGIGPLLTTNVVGWDVLAMVSWYHHPITYHIGLQGKVTLSQT